MGKSVTYATKSLNARLLWWAARPKEFFLRLVGEVYKWRHPQEPWISHHAVRYCKDVLHPSMTGLEWGSGRSTPWFANQLGKLTSVEHDRAWHQVVKKKLETQRVENVDYRFVELDHPSRLPTHKTYPVTPHYVKIADEFSDDSIDFVVVDGHYRQACIQAAVRKLRAGGLLLVDNSNWMPLAEWGVPDSWEIVHRSRGFEGETTIWQKPPSAESLLF